MNPNLAALLYLVAGVLFILTLRGLSSPETSRQGNRLGMLGMLLAVGVSLFVAGPDAQTLGLIVGGVALGGGFGAVVARRIPMTAMPQLVAAFHSLVGMAAVLVAAAALYTPEAYGIGAPRTEGRPIWRTSRPRPRRSGTRWSSRSTARRSCTSRTPAAWC